MISSGKYKISSLAKELRFKNKDFVEYLNKIGISGKTYSGTLDAVEYAVVMNSITNENQMVDLNSYIMGITELNDPNIVGICPPKDEPKSDPVTQKNDAPKKKKEAAGDDEKKAPEAEKTVSEPAVKDAAKNEASKNAVHQNEASKNAARKNEASKNASQNSEAPKSENKEAQHVKKDKQPKAPVDRFAARPVNNAPAKPVKKDNKPAQNKPSNVTSKGTVTEILVADSADESKTYTGSRSRVIDTRASDVNLSKYDEKLETFVESGSSSDVKYGRQKVKKQNKPAGQTSQSSSNQKGGKNQGGRMQGAKPYQGPNKGPKGKNRNGNDSNKPARQSVSVALPDEIAVGELASMLKVTAAEVIKRLMMLGVMANVNQVIDFDTAEYVATELGATVTKAVVVTIEDKLFDESDDSEEQLIERAPVVCVMGHVDHGKTSILDRIRHTNVTAGEAGGITQAIGAYTVNISGKEITFLDTPGHEAFTAMRARGAMATDIAILVVAADDGIMPQTIEAINHAKAAGVEIIVAINKMDKQGANPDAIKQELTAYDIIPEEWGGDVICVPVSALTGMGIEDLLENVLLVAELKSLRANPNRRAKGLVIEAKLDRGRGPVATVLVQNGTLKSGDIVIAGTSVGRVRAMTDDKGRTVRSAGPSVPVEIIGLSQVPESGEQFAVVQDEKMARELAEQRMKKLKDEEFKANAKVSLNDLFSQISSGVKELKIIVKADVGGSAEAVKASLVKLSNEEVKVNVIHTAVGAINEGDVNLASASNAIIIGFNVRPDKTAIDSAERQKVEIRTYRIIYECIEEVEAAMKGMLAPKFEEKILGQAEVRQTIRVPNVGTIAGSYILYGKISRNAFVRVVRDGVVIYEDKIGSLKRFKDDAKEVAAGYECGVGLEKFNDIKVGDILEAYEMVEIQR